MTQKYCIFCDPTARKGRVIHAGKLATSFLSSPRLVPGHVLVIPNRHVELPTDLTEQELTAIFQEIKPIIKNMLSSDLAKGVDTWQKTRPYIPQGEIKVDHVHFHLLPSKPGHQLYAEAL